MKVTIIDYGMGNLRSVAKAIESVAQDGTEVVVSSEAADIGSADRVVLPGQGAAAACVAAIDNLGLRQPIVNAVADKPFLGICMGLQVMLDHSDENGGVDCLGVVPGQVKPFATDLRDPGTQDKLSVPAMGWNRVQQQPHPMWEGIEDGCHFYFAHSFYVVPDSRAVCAAVSDYGVDFTSAIARDNLFACQFHPEKSAAQGLQLLRNFVSWTPVRSAPCN